MWFTSTLNNIFNSIVFGPIFVIYVVEYIYKIYNIYVCIY